MTSMMINKLGGALLLLSTAALAAQPGSWPRMTGNTAEPACQASLSLARAAYLADQIRPSPPNRLPRDFRYRRVFGSGVNAYTPHVDAGVFGRIKGNKSEHRSLYWQSKTAHPQRIVIEDTLYKDQDGYSVYAVEHELDDSNFSARLKEADPPGITYLMSSLIQQPEIFQDATSDALWVLSPGYLWSFSPDWNVFVHKDGRYGLACEIAFRPPLVKAEQMLPPPVRRLADLLKRSAGADPSMPVGSFADVFAGDIEQSWANAVGRPWAQVTAPRNSRARVDRELKAWASQSQANRKTYRAILRATPPAQDALTRHYRQTFHMERGEASGHAAIWLDRLTRSHFMFPEAEAEEASK